ncbi:MAG: M48 family metalloprotease [Pseudomonadota bacterium]
MRTLIQSSRLLSATAAAFLVLSCSTNPVTGKREVQFVSEGQEIQTGQQNYAPMRQSEGGDYEVLPELTAYVNEVGQKLAAASGNITVKERKLPYEFKVLNSSVPNAWALPGGKIAVNRGLLTELNNEAELAAVLGHEIVHAAAGHGAQAQTRGVFLQGGLVLAQLGAALGGVDEQAGSLLMAGSGVGAQLVTTRYGREAELESDLYGTRLMKSAGYDPAAAVSLQETFVRLSEGKKQNWLNGLFASHPPSAERVARNRETVAALGAGGDLGAARYTAHIAPLKQLKPGYDKYDQALAAMNKKDVAGAKSLAAEAVQLVPREGQFHQLLGDIALNEKRYQDAMPYYQKAMDLNPGYFGSWLGAGVAQYRLGNRQQARQWLTHSQELLPTAPASLYLGNMARDSGDVEGALKLYQNAATSESSIGQEAAREAVLMDLPRNPANYVAAAVQLGNDGKAVVVVQNRAPIALGAIAITPVVVNAAGQISIQGRAVTINGPLAAGQRTTIDAGLGALSAEQLRAVRVRVDSARVAQ